MPLQKLTLKSGVNRENTRYLSTGGWYESDKVRFRQGNPETIGGWQPISGYTYQGVCRSLWNWSTIGGSNYLGVGTNLKFYIENGGVYYDITPIRATQTLGTNPFTLSASTTATVSATAHGCVAGDFVTFSGATDIGGGGTNVTASVLNQQFQVNTIVSANSFTITLPVTPNATAIAGSPGGGSSVVAAYQVNVGGDIVYAQQGWGSGYWGNGNWGNTSSTSSLRIWNQINYGQDLVFGPHGGGLYFWSATSGLGTRGVLVNSLGGTVTITIASPAVVTSSVVLTEGAAISFSTTGALPTGISAGVTYYAYNVNGLLFNLLDSSGNVVNTSGSQSGTQSITLVDVPTVQNLLTVSDTSRFVITFGCNDYGVAELDPMLIRWSNQDDIYNWTPDATNQAGSIRLSHGSKIVAAEQTRQEIVVLTDTSVYSLQYIGPPYVWQSQLMGDNISIVGSNAVSVANNVVYWMGDGKFYMYDGRVQTLNCDLRRYIFSDINSAQYQQVYSGTNAGFNEIWWFYCSASSVVVDKYVVYNYAENTWYYGTMGRTAWIDVGISTYPQSATYYNNILFQEYGVNSNENGTVQPINSYVSSSEFDITDGNHFSFVWRMLPDLTFENSTAEPTTNAVPMVTMQLYGLINSGSGATMSASQLVAEGSTYNITEEFTGQIYTRIRGRQMIFKISSNQINTAWQLGATRIDTRPDGRR